MQGQTKLDDPIKVRWRPGRLRSRIQERAWDGGSIKDGDEWVPDYEGDDERAAHIFAALTRQKTNVVINTVEEAEAVYNELAWYVGGASDITWMNGSMQSSVDRVRGEILEELDKRGCGVSRHGFQGSKIEL